MPRDQINIRCGMDLKMILLQKENYSEFCRDAIIEKLDKENDPLYIDSKIKESQDEIKKWQIKKQKAPDSKEIKQFLEYWVKIFHDEGRDYRCSDQQNIVWIRDKILPAARMRGFRLNEKQILETLKREEVHVA